MHEASAHYVLSVEKGLGRSKVYIKVRERLSQFYLIIIIHMYRVELRDDTHLFYYIT